ncbi:glycosyltransferase, MGT family [Frankia torreyi]|uniref:Glycosyltransferase, MGT family n=3 Tax=Frankia TaxID=1854 RepID=A0A0D8BN35_9ACTN|nr:MULTISPECIES: glycosyltransferase [Frankia]KJE25520.1 glycosyltransferase, MGT family [Frankia torreyi]KQC36396.1 glycosyl transferase [Frankia sp. ACN1ag]
MARFLFATTPGVGHTAPAYPVARTLVGRGHSVRWYAGSAFADAITATGATFHPLSEHHNDFSVLDLNERFPGHQKRTGLRKLQFEMVHGFALPLLGHVRDLRALLERESADVIVGDTAFIAAALIQELGGPAFAGFGITVLGFPSRELAPFGLGLAPSAGLVGRLRNRALDQLMRRVVFRPMTAAVNDVRGQLGLAPTAQMVFEYPLVCRLYLQFSPPGFEYSVPDLPPQVCFVGPPRPLADPAWQPPAWWPELTAGRRVVLVNQGTVATDSAQLIRPALDALAGEDILVVAVTGGADPAELGTLPVNSRVERFIPFDELMPHIDVFLTNGGYGGTQLALSHGVPIVGAGRTEDKNEVNARVAWSGVGIDLRTQTPTAQQIRTAVRQVLADPRYATQARRLQAEIARAGREEKAADLLEQLADPAGAGPAAPVLPVQNSGLAPKT